MKEHELLVKISNERPYDSAIPHQVIVKELKPETQVDTCIQMFIVVLFTITKSGNNPNIHQ